MNYEKAIIQIKAKSLKAFQRLELEKCLDLLIKIRKIQGREKKQMWRKELKEWIKELKENKKTGEIVDKGKLTLYKGRHNAGKSRCRL